MTRGLFASVLQHGLLFETRLVSNSEFSVQRLEDRLHSSCPERHCSPRSLGAEEKSPGIRDKGLHMTDSVAEDWCLVLGY